MAAAVTTGAVAMVVVDLEVCAGLAANSTDAALGSNEGIDFLGGEAVLRSTYWIAGIRGPEDELPRLHRSDKASATA